MNKFLVIPLLAFAVACSSPQKTPPSELNTITDEALCDSLRSWGAADAHIDDNRVLLYGVAEGQISGDPDWVAQQYFELAVGCGVSDLKECRIIVLPKYNMIGRYKR